jgi:hypothetical protein
VELSPVVRAFAYGRDTWPYEILGFAALLLLAGLVSWQPGYVIPAAIVGGLGGALLYTNTTGDWSAWAYLWALIPGFVGVGLFLFGAWSGHVRGPWIAAGWLLAVSAVLFGVFGSFLGGPRSLAQWWPVALIALGLVFLAQSFGRRRPV